MFKSLPLSAAMCLLALAARAQSPAEIVLPGQLLSAAGATPETPAARPSSTIWQPTQSLVQNYSANAWVDYSRNNYLRYPTATPTLPGRVLTERKSGTAWAPYAQHRYRYTSAGQTQTDTVDQFITAPYGAYFVYANTFLNPSQPRYEWQMNHAPGTTAPWDTTKRNTHTYNAAGQRTQILEQFYSRRAFSDAARRLWTYNALGQISTYETQGTGSSAGTWSPQQRFTYTYNPAGKVQQAITEAAAIGTGTFSNSARNTYQFDAQGRESVLTTENWTNGAWARSSQTLYAYDINSNLYTATLQAWNTSTAAYQNYQRLIFSYQAVLGTASAAPVPALQLVPNPSATGTTATLRYELPAAAPVAVQVFDALGRLAFTRPAAAQAAGAHTLEMPALVPGLYVVRLAAGTQSQTTRLVVE